MKVKVEYSSQLRKGIGVGEEEVDLGERASVGLLLEGLSTRHAKAMGPFLAGGTFASLLVVRNGEQVFPDDPDPLREGDVVLLLTPMAGG